MYCRYCRDWASAAADPNAAMVGEIVGTTGVPIAAGLRRGGTPVVGAGKELGTSEDT